MAKFRIKSEDNIVFTSNVAILVLIGLFTIIFAELKPHSEGYATFYAALVLTPLITWLVLQFIVLLLNSWENFHTNKVLNGFVIFFQLPILFLDLWASFIFGFAFTMVTSIGSRGYSNGYDAVDILLVSLGCFATSIISGLNLIGFAQSCSNVSPDRYKLSDYPAQPMRKLAIASIILSAFMILLTIIMMCLYQLRASGVIKDSYIDVYINLNLSHDGFLYLISGILGMTTSAYPEKSRISSLIILSVINFLLSFFAHLLSPVFIFATHPWRNPYHIPYLLIILVADIIFGVCGVGISILTVFKASKFFKTSKITDNYVMDDLAATEEIS